MYIQRLYILVVICLLLNMQARASHLIGGNLGYEYVGPVAGGKIRYKIKLTTYVDCSPTSEIPFAEHPLNVGIYGHNMAAPLADKPLIDSVALEVLDTSVYTPFLPPGCTIGANTCIIQVNYVGYVDLNPSPNGYYLFYERCCRNLSIINLQPTQSSAFIAYIPPTGVVNSTPDFLYPPIPFMCVDDTVTIFNTAQDPDGDSLVYSFSTPYNGFGSSLDPIPPLPAPVFSWPVTPVDYVSGFTPAQPFSYLGNATLDTQTGISNYYSSIQGSFVVCVTVEEYRNGVLISTIRRDLQLIVLNCPNNYPPDLVDNLQKQYTLKIGDTLCFPISFKDPENDSAFVEAFGDIFDTAVMDTPAIFTVTTIDTNRVDAQFCWILPCSLDTGTYEFYVKSYDNGCPPKETYEFYTLHVLPADMPYLMGSDSACKTTDSVLYWMMPDEHNLYQWSVTNATIVQNLGDSIVVSFGTADSAEVLVDVFTANGCYIGSDSMTVTLIDVPVLTAMPDDSLCMGDTILLTATGIDAWYWYPEDNIIGNTQGNVPAIVDSSGWFYVAGLPSQLCPPSDSVFLFTFPLPVITATTNDSMLCKGDTALLTATGPPGLFWSPVTGLLQPDSAITLAIPEQSFQYIVTGTDTNGCINRDTLFLQVNALPTIQITADTSLCLGDTTLFTASGGSIYQWSPPAWLSSSTGASVLAFPPTAQDYELTVSDSLGCTSDTSFHVEVYPVPDPGFYTDSAQITCDGAYIQFHNTSTGATQYQWNLGNGNTSNDTDPLALYPFGQSFTIILTALNDAGCATDSVMIITTDSLEKLAAFTHVNVFTPDQNGLNDLLDFSLPLPFLPCTRVYIFDRWGMPMFENHDGNFTWDGKTGGKPVPEGVYYWIVEIAGQSFAGFVQVFY